MTSNILRDAVVYLADQPALAGDAVLAEPVHRSPRPFRVYLVFDVGDEHAIVSSPIAGFDVEQESFGHEVQRQAPACRDRCLSGRAVPRKMFQQVAGVSNERLTPSMCQTRRPGQLWFGSAHIGAASGSVSTRWSILSRVRRLGPPTSLALGAEVEDYEARAAGVAIHTAGLAPKMLMQRPDHCLGHRHAPECPSMPTCPNRLPALQAPTF